MGDLTKQMPDPRCPASCLPFPAPQPQPNPVVASPSAPSPHLPEVPARLWASFSLRRVGGDPRLDLCGLYGGSKQKGLATAPQWTALGEDRPRLS